MKIRHSNGEDLVPVHKMLSLSIANHQLLTKKDHTIGYKSEANVYLPDEQIKEELSKAFCSMEDVTDDNKRQVEELTVMKRNGSQLKDYAARVDQRPSIAGNKKGWCHESLSQ